jgi:hypothetical protein
MLWRRSPWKIGDAEEDIYFLFAIKINGLKPSYSIILVSNLL